MNIGWALQTTSEKVHSFTIKNRYMYVRIESTEVTSLMNDRIMSSKDGTGLVV